jgi:hypothetical protein
MWSDVVVAQQCFPTVTSLTLLCNVVFCSMLHWCGPMASLRNSMFHNGTTVLIVAQQWLWSCGWVSFLHGSKIGKLHSLEYTGIPNVFSTPHHVGHCCTVIRCNCCSTMYSNIDLSSHCCATMSCCTNLIRCHCYAGMPSNNFEMKWNIYWELHRSCVRLTPGFCGLQL